MLQSVKYHRYWLLSLAIILLYSQILFLRLNLAYTELQPKTETKHSMVDNDNNQCHIMREATGIWSHSGVKNTKKTSEIEEFLIRVYRLKILDFVTVFIANYITDKHGKAAFTGDRLQSIEQTDTYYQQLISLQRKYQDKVYYVCTRFKSYLMQYCEFKLQRKIAKKHIYNAMLIMLANKTEWVTLADVADEIYHTFTLKYELSKLSKIKSEHLVCGFNRTNCTNIPSVINQLIHQYIFVKEQYDYYDLIDCETIAKIVQKSKYLTQSKQQIDDDYDDDCIEGYGIKLSNPKLFYDPNWKDIDISDDDQDCAIEDFSENVLFVPHESLHISKRVDQS